MAVHEIVILGGNFAGVNILHHLLRQVISVLQKLPNSSSYHITLVSPNTHFYFKVGAPRALIGPNTFPEDKLFKSIPEAIKQYGEACTFVQGKATSLAAAAHEVTVELSDGKTQVLKFDSLFIGTGTTSSSALWTLHGDHKISESALNELRDLLPKTKSALIGGAGPVGVETAGEIATAYPDVKITLVGEVLKNLKPATITKAKEMLKNAKVEVLPNLRIQDARSEGGKTTVALSDGSSRTVDLFIDARGAHKINSEFVPATWLDKTGRIRTDEYFRAKGDGQTVTERIYVLGDIVAESDNTALQLDAQVPVAGSSFAVDVAIQLGHDVGGASSSGLLSWIPGFGSGGPTQKTFKPMKDTIIVPIGTNGGVGQMMGFQMPSFMVKKAKAEKFLVDLVEPAVTGSKYAKR
jgi:NADH dehydrogenase FAD-containing subunit